MAFILGKNHVLILRTCNADMTSHGGFAWPTSGRVEAPDWDPQPICGGGLHGLLWGEGDASLLDWSESAKGVVFSACSDDVVVIGQKVKAHFGEVVFVGTLREACAWLYKQAPGHSIPTITATAGDRGTATAGDRGTATAGDAGVVCLLWWDGKKYKQRIAEVGEGGLKPNTPYCLNDNGEFVEKEQS